MTAIIMLALLAAPGRAADPAPVALSTPTFQDFIVDSGLKLAAGEFALAQESASRAIALAPSNPKGYVQRASCELKLKSYPEAEADATKAIEFKYQKASPFNLRSAARSRMGRFAEALADADQALKYSPISAIGHMNRAAAQAGLKAPATDILADYHRAAELDARFKPVYDEFAKKVPTTAASALPLAKAAAPPAPAPAHVPAAAPAVVKASSKAPAPAPAKSFPIPALPWRPIAGSAAVLLLMILVLSGRHEHQLRQVRYGGLPVAPPMSEQLTPGSMVGGRYIVGAFTGRAGEVEFYEARDLSDSPRVLKRLSALRPPQDAGGSLARAQRAAALKSPHAEAIEAFVHEGGHLCLACVPLPGETLERLMKRLPGKKLAADAALRMAQGVCEALEAGHSQGLIHGRLKPSSLWVERGVGRLADFGLPPGGPAAYRPPEDEASVEADLYGLGACLYEALAGALPFDGEDADALKRESRLRPLSSCGGPGGLDSVMARALASDPRNRFHSAAEFLAAFKDAVSPQVS